MRLPELIDPLLCAAKGRHWQGKLALGRLGRLADMIANPAEDEVELDLRFHRDGRTPVVTGHVRAGLKVTCQRCLEPVDIAVDQAVNLGLVTSLDEGALLPEDYEPLLVGQERIRLADIVEDELILAIPLIPRHERCEMRGIRKDALERPNPFAVLADLKTKT